MHYCSPKQRGVRGAVLLGKALTQGIVNRAQKVATVRVVSEYGHMMIATVTRVCFSEGGISISRVCSSLGASGAGCTSHLSSLQRSVAGCCEYPRTPHTLGVVSNISLCQHLCGPILLQVRSELFVWCERSLKLPAFRIEGRGGADGPSSTLRK